jgi:hypothetical protein
VAGFCEHGNEPTGSIKGEKLFEPVSDYQLLKTDSGLRYLVTDYKKKSFLLPPPLPLAPHPLR